MIRSSFQSIDVSISREVATEYDNIKIVADNIDSVNIVAEAAATDAFNTVADNIVDVTNVASIATAISSLHTDKTTLDSLYADKVTLDSLYADKVTLDGLYADKVNIDIVANTSDNIDTVAADITSVTTTAGSIDSVVTVATNIDAVHSFANTYLGVFTIAPTVGSHPELSKGDLYYDSVIDELRVYNGSSWRSAGSTVNGTSKRQSTTTTEGQTVVPVIGGYDPYYADVYLNGTKLLNDSDVDISDGVNVVLAIGATSGDIVDIVAYGTFSVADHYTKLEIDSRISNVDNTSDINKPISTATQTALNDKALDSTVVHKTGDETIADVKTFTSSPIVPTPILGGDAVNKDYVDVEVTGANNYTDTRVNDVVGQLSTDYYQGPYGISWDYATDTYIRTGAKGYTAIQRLMRRCVLNADGTINYYLNPDNSNFKEDGTPSVLTGADGNVMVEIPKHYIKVETVGNVDSLSVSLAPEVGYVLDPAFLKWNGTEMVEVPYRYFRAYEGFVSGGKLLSVSGVTPTRTQAIATFRTQAMTNGDGWHLTDWNLLNTIKRLCYIEFCDFIVTKYLGEGNHTGSDYGITTGQSNALGNRSSNSTHNNMYMTYRGIENMYADIWEFVDGVNINNYQFYVNGNYSTFQSDVFTGNYVAKGPLTVAGASNSLIKRCAVSVDGGFIPTVVGGSTTTFYGDALWSATGAIIAFYGGAANDGASAGLGTLYVGDASSISTVIIGAAVCR